MKRVSGVDWRSTGCGESEVGSAGQCRGRRSREQARTDGELPAAARGGSRDESRGQFLSAALLPPVMRSAAHLVLRRERWRGRQQSRSRRGRETEALQAVSRCSLSHCRRGPLFPSTILHCTAKPASRVPVRTGAVTTSDGAMECRWPLVRGRGIEPGRCAAELPTPVQSLLLRLPPALAILHLRL